MCITKVESFDFAGKLYPTELEAVTAALTEIATSIVKQHSAHPLQGLLHHGEELPNLLRRYSDLCVPGKATEVTSEESQKGPKGTQATVYGYPVEPIFDRLRVVPEEDVEQGRRIIAAYGFTSFDAFLQGRPGKTAVSALREALLMDDGIIG